VWRIADKFRELTPELERIGFGKISFLYQIVKRGGKWTPRRLLEAERDGLNDGGGLPSSLRDYLRKYLRKALDVSLDTLEDLGSVNPSTLYWALNSRFFTYSRELSPRAHLRLKDHVTYFRFYGTGYVDEPEELPFDYPGPPWLLHIPGSAPPLYVLRGSVY